MRGCYFASLLMGALLLIVPPHVDAQVPRPAQPTPRPASEPVAAPDYVVGISDVQNVLVWREAELSGKYAIGADGTILFPLVGRVAVAGATVRDIEGELTKRLADGFLRKPQVTVTVETFRSQQVFVVGEVRIPGSVALTGDLTLVEALTQAGSLTDMAGGDVILMRPSDPESAGAPVLPGTPGAVEVQRVNLQELRAGKVAENVSLKHGDTIFVTRAETIFVQGQVNNPGAFTMEKEMTVLRALSLAGGATQLGTTSKIRIRRIVDGKVTEVRVKLTDLVQPGDTIIVPTRLF